MIALEASQSLAPEDRNPWHGLIASQYFKFTSTLHSLERNGISSPLIWLILHIVDSNKSPCSVWALLCVCIQLYLVPLDVVWLLAYFSVSIPSVTVELIAENALEIKSCWMSIIMKKKKNNNNNTGFLRPRKPVFHESLHKHTTCQDFGHGICAYPSPKLTGWKSDKV